MRRFLIISFLSLLPLVALSTPPMVVTSFSILEDITYQIGKENIETISLVKSDQNAHHYMPTPQDIITLEKSSLVIMNGLHFDDWLYPILKNNNLTHKLLVSSEGIETLKYQFGKKVYPDPHIWQDPKNVIAIAHNIKNRLIEIDPENSNIYEENYNTYIERLTELDKWAKEKLSVIPENKRHYLVIHDSFRYLGEAYNLHFYSIMDINITESITAKDLIEINKKVKELNIKVLFSENIEYSQFTNILLKDLNLTFGGSLHSDALSKEGETSSYEAFFKHNIETILKASQ